VPHAVRLNVMTERYGIEIRERREGHVVVVDLVGRMVLTEGESDSLLRDRVLGLVDEGHLQVIVNLSQVAQVDTSGLKQLLSAHLGMSRRGARLVLANPTKRIRDLLAVTRLNTLFEVFDTEAAAIDGLGARFRAQA
jgi:anti-sigma B factor antagonist